MTKLQIIILKIFLYSSLICFSIGIYLLGIAKFASFLKANMEHPCPRLSKIFPIIERIDEILCLSAGIEWYKCKDKYTNEEYLVFTSDYPFIKIMNYKTRDKFETLTRNEFLRRFEQPIYGIGYENEEEAFK